MSGEVFKYIVTILNSIILLFIAFYLHALVNVQEKYISESLKKIDSIVHQARDSIDITNRSIDTTNRGLDNIKGVIKNISEDIKRNNKKYGKE